MSKRSFSEAWPSKYMTTADIKGKSFTATIKSIEYEKLRDGGEKPVAYFEKLKKGVVLNKTKGTFLTELTKSPDFDNWVGVDIQIREGLTTYAGDEIPCIKFDLPAAAKKKQIKDALNDDLPPNLKGDPDEDEDM